MREQIEHALQPLVGEAMWGTSRAADMQMFQFGKQHPRITRHGQPYPIGDYGLHIQCPWRIVGPEGIVVGSHDVYYPAGKPDEEPSGFQWGALGANRRDERIGALFAARQENPLIVQAVAADAVGGAALTLNDGYVLELFPHDSLPGEHWRLLNNVDENASHFVVTGMGIEL